MWSSRWREQFRSMYIYKVMDVFCRAAAVVLLNLLIKEPLAVVPGSRWQIFVRWSVGTLIMDVWLCPWMFTPSASFTEWYGEVSMYFIKVKFKKQATTFWKSSLDRDVVKNVVCPVSGTFWASKTRNNARCVPRVHAPGSEWDKRCLGTAWGSMKLTVSMFL